MLLQWVLQYICSKYCRNMNMHGSSQAGLDFSLPCIDTTAALSTIMPAMSCLKSLVLPSGGA